LRRWLRRLHDDLHVTSVFVTHDQEEALEVADRVVIMNHGRVEQIGSPEEVYARPASPFVIDFLGDVNLFHCRIDDGRVFVGSTPLDVELADAPANGVGTVYIRPHILTIELERSSPHAFPATIVHVTRTGPIAKSGMRHGVGRDGTRRRRGGPLRCRGLHAWKGDLPAARIFRAARGSGREVDSRPTFSFYFFSACSSSGLTNSIR
jgi:ABC-type sulfate/molybdate transport systems ATPase subunit